MSELLEVRDRALAHYAKKLRFLTQDEEDEQSEILKNDLFSFAEEVQKLVGARKENIANDNTQIISDAFSCYINDLNESKETIYKKLPNLKPVFKSMDKEVEMAKLAKDKQ